jgi:hypothetical protein
VRPSPAMISRGLRPAPGQFQRAAEPHNLFVGPLARRGQSRSERGSPECDLDRSLPNHHTLHQVQKQPTSTDRVVTVEDVPELVRPDRQPLPSRDAAHRHRRRDRIEQPMIGQRAHP